MQIVHIVSARPNFMKAAPVLAAFARHEGVTQRLIHTGQHYDANMSDVFFRQLGLPEPDVNLGVGSGSHAVQTAQAMVQMEEQFLAERPDLVLVYGDVNPTAAAALVCAKLHVPVGHVEAGLRSFDRTMPEEVNRLVTDQLADLLFTPSLDGDENLAREGVDPTKVHFVGNVMIDTLVRLLPQAEAEWPRLREELGIDEESYGLVTLHRPSNVDDPEALADLVETLDALAERLTLVFPVHPRTRKRMADLGIAVEHPSIRMVEPIGYLGFLALQRHAKVVVTDSGGVQEETTYLGVPCITVRENTERPVTITEGTNVLVGQDMDRLRTEVERVLDGQARVGERPDLWDGGAGERIAEIVVEWAGVKSGVEA